MNKSLSLPPIYIISGGKGFAGNNLVQTVLVQFPENKIPVILIPNIVTVEQVEKAVNDIANTGGIVVHTMVDQHLRLVLNKICQEKKIKTIDLMVDLISYISEILEEKPLSQPGLFRILNLEYFDRIESIEYTVSNDDGLSPQTLQNADIVLTGVSRTGKTPLSMYLAMFGWKVANIPLIKDISPPEELFKLDHKRVIGLNINLNQLLSHRRKRLQSFGNVGDTDYINPATIRQELDYAFSIFQKGYFSVINVTGKPIESIANEIIKLITQRFKAGSRKSK